MFRAHRVASLAAAIDRLRTSDAPADAALRAFFQARPALGKRDRALVSEGAFAFVRRMRSLTALAQSDDPYLLALATLVHSLGYPARELGAVVESTHAGWLADFEVRRNILPLAPAAAADVPDWLWSRLGEAYGPEERDALVKALNQPASFDLRINPLATTREAALAALTADGFEVCATPLSPLGIRVAGRPMITKHTLFIDGRLEVQDEGSQVVGHLVAPRRHDVVVDFCAGAGGKALLVGALMRSQGHVYAFDIADHRLASLRTRLARSGLSNVHPQRIANERDGKLQRLAGKVDRVLVDAPCSGLGTLRRNPDLKWRHDQADVARFARAQSSILDAACALLKSGGRLVYATCSVLPEENEAIVEGFLATHPNFGLGDAAADLKRAAIPLDTGRFLQLLPHRHGCDGFFAAVIEKD